MANQTMDVEAMPIGKGAHIGPRESRMKGFIIVGPIVMTVKIMLL
jgi:hypothetical protein